MGDVSCNWIDGNVVALVHVCPFCGVKFSSRNTLDAHVVYYCSKKPLPLTPFESVSVHKASHDKDNVSLSDTTSGALLSNNFSIIDFL